MLTEKLSASPEWRRVLHPKVCKACSATYEGRYNSTKCPACRPLARERAAVRFKANNPDYWKKHQAGRKNKTRDESLRRQYGLSKQEFDDMRAQQEYRCKICGAEEGTWKANAARLVVDHCHATGRIRGLLCPSCNRGLGQFEDQPLRLLAAVTYLTEKADGDTD